MLIKSGQPFRHKQGVPPYRQYSKNQYFVLYSGMLKTCKSIKISRSVFITIMYICICTTFLYPRMLKMCKSIKIWRLIFFNYHNAFSYVCVCVWESKKGTITSHRVLDTRVFFYLYPMAIFFPQQIHSQIPKWMSRQPAISTLSILYLIEQGSSKHI
jgi:hypothetical protein